MSAQADVTIIGAGLLGLASAWALQEKGFKVEVIEAEAGPGSGTSFANSGMLTPSMADPWNSPGILRQLIRWLGREDAPMLLRLTALPDYFLWGLKFLRHSAQASHQAATRGNFELAIASLAQFSALRNELNLSFDHKSKGTLQVFRVAHEFAAAKAVLARLQPFGLQAEVLSADTLVAAEPVLSSAATPLLGGILYSRDETGDAHLFCRSLERELCQRGVVFHYGQAVTAIAAAGADGHLLSLGQHRHPTKRLVIAAANGSVALCRMLGLRLPVRPVKGYSLTLACEHCVDQLPSRAIIDHHLHGAMTPLGARIRLAGTAELAGWNSKLNQPRLDNLWKMFGLILPSLQQQLDRAQGQPWAGLRPMSADGLPFIGQAFQSNVYLNTGHGHLGWTQSLGSGRLLADLMSRDKPQIDPTPYRISR